MACLIAREARVPKTGAPLSDRLEEEAQRNANAVTSSLKRTVRDAIEILGQEVLDVTNGSNGCYLYVYYYGTHNPVCYNMSENAKQTVIPNSRKEVA